MFAIIFITLFFLVIIILVVVAVFGSKKDKQKQQIDLMKKKKDDKLSKDNSIRIIFTLYILLEDVTKDVKNFKPSIGTKSIGDINSSALKIIKNLNNSKEVKEIYLITERENEIRPILEELKKVKPIKWEDQAFFAVNVIRNKAQSLLINNKQNQKLLEEIRSEFKYTK
ncbi:MAG: hypothetical protein HPPSJP_0910 [Candidatus Hepatoplasma scabrum]|nr:MAG: hypothetical protein HPPSJP_0910 [Candidatus Hepatoplasma sp.]